MRSATHISEVPKQIRIGYNMDRRWILILIIIILAVCCGYYIASNSDNVGNAIIDINKSTAVLPPSFSVGGTELDSVSLYQKNATAKIFIKDLGKGKFASDKIKKINKTLSNDPNIKILDDSNNISQDREIYTLYYQNYSDTESFNQSVSYLNTINHTFLLKCSGFDDINQIDKNLNFLAETIKPDYKKSQE